jgi:hypothetical protein
MYINSFEIILTDDWVSGELFCSICDLSIYDKSYLNTFKNLRIKCKSVLYNNEPVLENKINIINSSFSFFVKTDHIPFFIKSVLPLIKHKFILITHNSDLYSGQENIIINNPYLLKWFGQNMKPVIESNKLEGIPIGLENRQWIGWKHDICKMYKNENKINNVYFNFSTNTNPSARIPFMNYCVNKNFQINDKVEWKEYIKTLSTYKYCFSPEGNGVDCHRIWECIYVGCVPIVIKNKVLTDYFENLPILWINSYDDINLDLLEKSYKSVINNKDVEKITLTYWKNRIKLLM